MQIMIDTAADSPEQLYRISTFLRSLADAASLPAAGPILVASTETPAPPAAPVEFTLPPGLHDIGDNDVEVEIDSEGNVTQVAATVELPAAPPPPPVAAPLPPAMPAPPGPAVPAELDSRGMPWDARIHAGNRAKKIDNSWKNKRGVDAAMVAACEAQNKPGNAPTPITATPATVPAVAPATTAAPTAAASAPPPPPPPAPTAGIAAPAAVAPSAIDFRGLMQKIQGATAAGKLSADQVNAALAGVGLKPEEMAQLINNAPLIASVNAAVDKCIS